MDDTPDKSVWQEYRTDQVGRRVSRDIRHFVSHDFGAKRNHGAASQGLVRFTYNKDSNIIVMVTGSASQMKGSEFFDISTCSLGTDQWV